MRRFAMLSLLLSAAAPAQAPALLGYQARLLKTDGTPLSGKTEMVFKLFDQESGAAAALWTETQMVSVNSEGHYAVFLGSGTPLPPGVFDGTPRFLEVSVGGTPLVPRQKIVSVAYALNAAQAQSVKGGPAEVTSVSVKGKTVIDSNGGVLGAVPTGAVVAFAGGTAPAGWALCDGATHNPIEPEFAALCALLGAVPCKVPDLRGRFVLGASAVAGQGLGQVGGAPGNLVHSHSINHAHGAGGGTTGNVNTFAKDTFQSGGALSGGQHDHSIPAPDPTTSGPPSTDPPFEALNFIIKL